MPAAGEVHVHGKKDRLCGHWTLHSPQKDQVLCHGRMNSEDRSERVGHRQSRDRYFAMSDAENSAFNREWEGVGNRKREDYRGERDETTAKEKRSVCVCVEVGRSRGCERGRERKGGFGRRGDAACT